MGMNTQQRKYALERLYEILKRKTKELEAKHESAVDVDTTREEMARMIREGEVQLRALVEHGFSFVDQASALFDFEELKAADEKSREELDAERNELRSAYNQARDAVMLGDAQDGLRLIAELESYSV